jgi:hypothetical protein
MVTPTCVMVNLIWPFFLLGVDLLRLGADIGGGSNTEVIAGVNFNIKADFGGGFSMEANNRGGISIWRHILKADLKWRWVCSSWGQIVLWNIL